MTLNRRLKKDLAPKFAAQGVFVIDNSSAFRMEKDIPLIVPEVNPDAVRKDTKIIANPNCSTIQMVVALKPLHDAAKIKRVIVSTYQAVSGAGGRALDEFANQVMSWSKGEPIPEPAKLPHRIAFNVIPQIDVFVDNGYTKEEMKMVNETRKMLHKPELPISATCIRVPVPNSHGVSIMAELNQEFKIEDVKELFANYPGLKLVDKPLEHLYPTSTIANGNDFIYVGRIRRDLSSPNGILFYTVSDNIRKGAASNAVQIAKYIVENEML